MHLFGKILAIVNALAVVGVSVLLAMNYSKRLNWEHAVFRQDLMMNGLPLDDKETDQFQESIAAKIGAKTQEDLFKQADPKTPVATQEAEVARVKNALASSIQAAADTKKQIDFLAAVLIPMADTIAQRSRLVAYRANLRDDRTFNALKARLFAAHQAATAPQQGRAKPYEERFADALAVTFSDPPGPFAEAFVTEMKANPNMNPDAALNQSLSKQLDQLQKEFEAMFRNALNGGEGAQPGAPSQQKRTIARLLFNMIEILSPPAGNAAPSLRDPAYQRFFIVVGVKAAVEAVNDQANVLQGLTFETKAERQRERDLFALEHRKAVSLVLDKKAAVDQHTTLVGIKKKEKETHDVALEGRRRNVKEFEDQLAAERQKTAHNLELLRQLSAQLFDERVKLREKSEDNQKLEKDIRTLETGR
jgi:hypothetical protein